jgi:hypothetical protein
LSDWHLLKLFSFFRLASVKAVFPRCIHEQAQKMLVHVEVFPVC